VVNPCCQKRVSRSGLKQPRDIATLTKSIEDLTCELFAMVGVPWTSARRSEQRHHVRAEDLFAHGVRRLGWHTKGSKIPSNDALFESVGPYAKWVPFKQRVIPTKSYSLVRVDLHNPVGVRLVTVHLGRGA
jgi:hypothetical protein